MSLNLNVLEDLTLNAKQIQEDILQEILTLNAKTEYLQQFLHGSSDKILFKKMVPIVSYEDVQPYLDRVVNGETSAIISGEPITRFLLSSGTSGGKQKLLPCNNKYFQKMKFIDDLYSVVISKHINGIEKGKCMMFSFASHESATPSGLPAGNVTTSFFKSDYFESQSSYWYYQYTSPHDVTLCQDSKQGLYCHFLCGLSQRDKVVRISSVFASVLVRAIAFFENSWEELCSNIRTGQISEWITDLNCKKSVSDILGGPNPELADLIARECSQKSWQGIIPRLWPNTKFIETIVTGQFAQYIPALEFYTNNLTLVNTMYASSEAFLGINVDPLCKPQDMSYTFLPNMAYVEFESTDDGNKNEIFDLVDVKLGCYYELLVTNFSGLHRYRVGDVFQVTGFYNNAPQFKFIRRKNVVLSVYMEVTTEEDFSKAVNNARTILESSDLMLIGFTSYADIATNPGHYVIYFEIKTKTMNGIVEFDKKILEDCCSVMEESLSVLYRRYRTKEGLIGALEIRTVQEGAFDSLADYFISQGASLTQYKTPMSVKSTKALEILENNVLGSFFSTKLPTLTPLSSYES